MMLRLYVVVALALSITLSGFALWFGIWQLGVAHLFVAGALACAYTRPLDLNVLDERRGRQ